VPDNDCDHEDVIDSERLIEERPWDSWPVGFVGTCKACGASMTLTGDEDDEGHPTWEVADGWTPEDILMIAHQSGLL
jgi:hypothetical protein